VFHAVVGVFSTHNTCGSNRQVNLSKIGRLGDCFRKDHQHRFNGELLKTRIEKKNGSTVLSSKIFTYELDHLGRKSKFKHNLGSSEKTIAKYEYDQIGRLNQKLQFCG